jgi:hypothetical protein
MQRQLSFALMLLACSTTMSATNASAASSGLTQLAQAQTEPSQPAAPATAAPDPTTPDATAPATDAQAPEEPIGNVATVTGSASVIRNDQTTPLKVKDDIYLNDVVQTAANSALGITFIDATTFNLKASTKITIDNYVYEDGGKSNAAIFDVAKGTAAFVAASVAKTGDMKITTPTATLGIRGTTGLVEVPEGAAANNPNNVAVKLYPDADGRVGRIEVNDRAGARLGFLTQGASGFTIRPGAGGARFAAVPLAIPQAVMQRDQGFVRQLHSMQNVGRQVVFQQREFRRANPTFVNPNRPIRQQLQPGQQRPNGLPGQVRPGQQQPGQLNRPGQPRQNGLPGQPGQPPLPAVPNRQGQQQPGQLNRPGQPQQPGQFEPARSAATARRAEPPGTTATRLAQSARRAAAGRTTVTPRSTGTARTAAACGTTATNRSAAAARPAATRRPTATAVCAARRAAGTAGTAEQVWRARTAARARRSGRARPATAGTARRAAATCATTRQAAAKGIAVRG